MHTFPQLKCGSFALLSSIPSIQQFKPYADKPSISYQPKRKQLEAPLDDGRFILPMKQSFMMNPRLGNGVKIMLSILLGLGGNECVIKTTTITIGKMMNRSRRTIYTYIQEAVEEGYLTYSKLKSRMGYYIGLKIYLNYKAIRKSKTVKKKAISSVTLPKTAEASDGKETTHINRNININKQKDEELMSTLTRFALELGYIKPPE